MRQALTLAVLLIFAAPTSLAGTEANPEIDDHPDRKNAALDLLAAWFEPHPDGVKFTVKVVGTDTAPPDALYFVMFTTTSSQRYLVGVGFDLSGNPHAYVGTNNLNGNSIEGAETFTGKLQDISFRPGEPAFVSAIIPWGAVPGLEPSRALGNVGAGTAIYNRANSGWSDQDIRTTELTYVIEKPLVTPFVRDAMLIALGVIALVLVTSGATYLVVRRKLGRTDAGMTPDTADAPTASTVAPSTSAKFGLRPPE